MSSGSGTLAPAMEHSFNEITAVELLLPLPRLGFPQGGVAGAVNPAGFDILHTDDPTNPSNVRVEIDHRLSAEVSNMLFNIELANVRTLTMVLRFTNADREETTRIWAHIDAILAGLKQVAPGALISLRIENPVPLAVLRGGVATDAFGNLRRFLFGVDKHVVALVDAGTLSSPVRFAPRMPEEDEVRLRCLFPALSDYGMLAFL